MDDIIFTYHDINKMYEMKNSLATKFQLKDLGGIKFFLKMKRIRSKNNIMVSRRRQLLDLLNETRMSSCS